MKPKPGVSLNEVTKITLSHHDDSIVVIHNSVSRAHVLNLAPAAPGGNNNNAGPVVEKYSGFLVVLMDAIVKAKVRKELLVKFFALFYSWIGRSC